jgi:L-alanine-DL-glutamate epimerase-like enolase superfamily enzyme
MSRRAAARLRALGTETHPHQPLPVDTTALHHLASVVPVHTYKDVAPTPAGGAGDVTLTGDGSPKQSDEVW